MSTSQEKYRTLIDGILHSQEINLEGNPLDYFLQLYISDRLNEIALDEPDEFANNTLPSSEKITAELNSLIVTAAKMNLEHLLVKFTTSIKSRKLRITAIPYLLRSLPTHPIEAYFSLRSIGAREIEKVKLLEIGVFLDEKRPIDISLPINHIAIAITYFSIHHDDKIDILSSIAELSKYKFQRLYDLIARILLLNSNNFPTESKHILYLRRVNRLLHSQELISNIIAESKHGTLVGINQYLTKNEATLLKQLQYFPIEHISQAYRNVYALLRLWHPDKIIQALGIDKAQLVNSHNSQIQWRVILVMLIESSAWHRLSPYTAQFLAIHIRKNKAVKLPQYIKGLMFDAMKNDDFSLIWKTNSILLQVKEIMDINHQLLGVKSHELNRKVSDMICKKDISEWYEFLKSPIGKGKTKDLIISTQLIAFAQNVNHKSLDDLKSLIDSIYLPEEHLQKLNKIILLRKKFNSKN